ncbi:MAG: VWA domain-containing protein [Bacteroidetes bacterium]|nr:MAG: VWA domain-containing protein [Bacteroidota bacterium]
MKNLILTLTLLLSACFVFAQDDAPKPIIFITDASGSMWQKIGDDHKITLAREVLGDLTSGMSDNQPVGLVAYGHRKKGDCGDIEELLPMSNLDKAAFQKEMKALNPLGKTPLAQSAKFVIDKLKADGQSATIILITDGIETCEGILCDVVKEAKEAGIDFVMHVVGFDLGDADRAPLECAAREGDGFYIDASDKDQLADALEETTEVTVDVPKGRLSVLVRRNGELIDGAIEVLKPGTDDDITGIRSYNRPETNPALINLPAGTYDVEVSVVGQRGIPAIRKEQIVVTESDVNEQIFDFSSGHVTVEVTNLGALHDATVRIRKYGETKIATSGRTYVSPSSNPIKKELAPGVYDVIIQSTKIKGATSKAIMGRIHINPNKTTRLTHDFQSAELSVGALYNGALSDASVNIVSVQSGQSVAAGRTYTSASSNPKKFILSPGEYKVTVKGIKIEGDPKKSFTITLKAGDNEQRMVEW